MKFASFIKEADFDSKIDYHEELNPKLWMMAGDRSGGERSPTLKPEVMDALDKIAKKFIEALKLPQDVIRDVVLTGSNCNYNYTALSDLDIHIEVDINGCPTCSIDSEDCIQAKKTLWNDKHDIEIYGIPVEMYATSNIGDVIAGAGAFSLTKMQWITLPKKENVTWSQAAVNSKAEEISKEIDQLVSSSADEASLQELHAKIMRMRQSGLKSGGEFSLENLTFKALRNNGYVQKLRAQIQKAEDDNLSLK